MIPAAAAAAGGASQVYTSGEAENIFKHVLKESEHWENPRAPTEVSGGSRGRGATLANCLIVCGLVSGMHWHSMLSRLLLRDSIFPGRLSGKEECQCALEVL